MQKNKKPSMKIRIESFIEKHKKPIFIGFAVLLLISIGLYVYAEFFHKSTNQQAKASKDYFLKYDIFKGSVYTMNFEKGKFLVRKEKKVLYTTEDRVIDFYVKNENELVFLVQNPANLDGRDDEYKYLIYLYNISDGSTSIIAQTYYEYLIEVNNDKIYACEKESGVLSVYEGSKRTAKESYNMDGTYLFDNSSGVYLVSSVSIENKNMSDLYRVGSDGKLTFLIRDTDIVDAFVNEKAVLYFLAKDANSGNKVIKVKNLNDKSTSLEKQLSVSVLSDVTGSLIFMKGKTVLIDRSTKAAYLVNSDYYKVKKVFDFGDILWRFIQYDEYSDRIYFIDKNGDIKYYE